jgi:hypothetical protein
VDFDALIENVSWASVGGDTMLDRDGRDVGVVVAKVAYRVAFQGDVRLILAPIRRGEVRDEAGGVWFPDDLAADEKPGTDIGLVGTAAPPPRASGRTQSYAWLSVGHLRKVISIFGPRTYTKGWRGVAPSDPAPLVEPVPLRFDQCFGGIDPVTGASEPHNPLGIGFSSNPAGIIGKPAPPLEPAPTDGPAPHPSHAAFAPIPAQWEPRRSLIGTHDEAWTKKRAPLRPKDFNPRHHNWSVPGLHNAIPFVGDEPIEVGGVLPEGVWKIQLPTYAVRFESVIAGETASLETHLDSLHIDADTRVVELCWRASVRLPRKWELVDRIRVLGVGKLSEDVIRGRQPPPGEEAIRAQTTPQNSREASRA